MKLATRLFASYLMVVAVTLLVIALSIAVVAPVNFQRQVRGIDTMFGTGTPSAESTREARPADEPDQGAQPGPEATPPADGRSGGPRMPGAGRVFGGPPGGPGPIEAILTSGFRGAVNNALLLGGIAAVLAAVLASLLISKRIVEPIRELVSLSQFIAAGHYDRRLNKSSDDEIGELTDSFNQMAGTLSETEAMRRQLLGDVTHELKTPLAGIKGYIEGMEDGIIPATPETFQIIHRETSRLQRLVEDLQELSRIEGGQTHLHPTSFDPISTTRAVVERMGVQFRDKAIAVSVDVAEGVPHVQGDFDRFGQVLTNLLGNALQYTPEGGTVHVAVQRDDHAVRVAIRDSGVGLAPADLERVFQRFYRVDKSRARASGGSGVGLTIARSLVEAQGGRLWAESAGPGLGSTFSFTLPTA